MSSSKQGLWSRFKLSPNAFRHFMNLWPPLIVLRVHILRIAPDWRQLRLHMKLSLRNKNYVGSHFGGGLFAMVDPFYMLLLMNLLGKDYLVWDKSAKIDFIAPGRTTVFADFNVTDEMLAEIYSRTATGEKFEPTYRVDIVDTQGKLVARVEKTMYIRRKRA